MRICLIRPRVGEKKLLGGEEGTWKAARFAFNKVSRVKLGGGSTVPPLALLVLAALTPLDFEITIVDEEIEEIDFDCDVDVVGITLLTTTAHRGYEIADRFRERGTKVVLGGIHATVLPEEAAQHADAVVIGEAEEVWYQVLADVKAGRLEHFYRSGTSCNMQRMPIPRRDLLSKQAYLTTNLLESTRGCPNRCSFCSIQAVTGNTYRCRPVPEVISDIETLGNPPTVFVDDNIIAEPTYAKELFKAMIPLKTMWVGQATLAITADKELLDLAAKSGCKILVIGFESLSAENIRVIGKARTNKVTDYREAVKKLHTRGICVAGSFIIGLDNDDTSVFSEIVEFIQKNNIDLPRAGVLTPYPGTHLFKKLDTEGRLIHQNWRYYGRAVVFHPKLMTPEELEQGQRFVAKRIYSLQATTKRLLGVRRNLVPTMAYSLNRRKMFS